MDQPLSDFGHNSGDELKARDELKAIEVIPKAGKARAFSTHGWRCPECGAKFQPQYPIEIHWKLSKQCRPIEWRDY